MTRWPSTGSSPRFRARDGDPVLVVYPGGMPDDGTEASALANHLARLGTSQRKFVQRVIGDAAAGEGRVV